MSIPIFDTYVKDKEFTKDDKTVKDTFYTTANGTKLFKRVRQVKHGGTYVVESILYASILDSKVWVRSWINLRRK